MTPLERQFALKKIGITQKQIAIEEGKSEMMVSAVIRGERVSDPLMRAISKNIGKHHTEVFPQYYLQPAQRKTSKVA